jgi:hypothetical protein
VVTSPACSKTLTCFFMPVTIEMALAFNWFFPA